MCLSSLALVYFKYTESRRTNNSFDPELNLALRRMSDPQNPSNLGDGINRQLPSPVDAHNQVIVENPGDGALRRQPPAPLPQEYYRGNVNITNSDRPLLLPPLP